MMRLATDARARWDAIGAARFDDGLAPGLAAELAVGLCRVPLALVERHGEIVWSGGVAVPTVRDPQLFEPLFRVARVIAEQLPALVRALADRDVIAARPDALEVVGYRKGSWTEVALDQPGAVVCTIAITGGAWPRAWGGHDARLAPDGSEAWCGPVVAGAIELANAASVRRVEVLTHRVERIELRALLVPR